MALSAAAQLDTDALTPLRQRLAQLDTQARQQFAEMAQHLTERGLPAVLHQRHREAVATYAAAVTTLRQQLDDLAVVSTPPARRDKAAQAVQHLRATQPPRPKRAFDPHRLPFRTPDGTVRAPKETPHDDETALTPPQPGIGASIAPPGRLAAAPVAALPATPTPDELAPTEDVQLTDEIRALAASLAHHPVQIYHWVHDQIEFMPTYGSIQGAHMALQTKRGNAFDTASLLIALLRAANIPARYVYGTVQIPMDQVMNWVGGVTVPEAALQVLGQGGIPSTGMVQGSVLTAVRLEHVWVEAWVDFFPSQGAKHVQGDTWVPLDASFKQYKYTPGMDLQGQVPFDAQGFVTQVTDSTQGNLAEGWIRILDPTGIQNALTAIQAQVHTYVTAQKPHATFGDVLGTTQIIPARRLVLAAGLPYQLVVRGLTVRLLPDHLRHKFRVTLYASALDRVSESPVLYLEQSLPALAGKKLTLSFAPASQADADLLASFLPRPPADGRPLEPSAFPASLPGYLIRLVAELRVDGQVVARGGRFTMGQVLVSTAGLYDPGRGWHDLENTPPIAGEYRAWAINAAGIAATQLEALHTQLAATQATLAAGHIAALRADDLTGDLLYSTMLSYFAANEVFTRLSAQAAGMVTSLKPSFGSFVAKVQPHFLFGIPRTVTFPGLELDITRLESLVVSAVNNRAAQVAYVRQSGLRQSAYEHLIPERLFTDAQHPGAAVSAVKALGLVEAQGQRLYSLTPDTLAHALPQLSLPPDVTGEIQEAVATGKIAVVSQREVTVGPWTGVGYIMLDPETGAGAYQISGGANGAFAFARGAEAGTLILLGVLTVAATVTVTGPFIIPAYSLLVGELAVVITGFKILYDLVPVEDRPCFWAGFGMVFFWAGFPGVIEALRLALGFELIAALPAMTLKADSPSKCVFGITLPW